MIWTWTKCYLFIGTNSSYWCHSWHHYMSKNVKVKHVKSFYGLPKFHLPIYYLDFYFVLIIFLQDINVNSSFIDFDSTRTKQTLSTLESNPIYLHNVWLNKVHLTTHQKGFNLKQTILAIITSQKIWSLYAYLSVHNSAIVHLPNMPRKRPKKDCNRGKGMTQKWFDTIRKSEGDYEVVMQVEPSSEEWPLLVNHPQIKLWLTLYPKQYLLGTGWSCSWVDEPTIKNINYTLVPIQ